MMDEHLISLQPGTVIAGRYEVVKCLGAGSMGLVYACRHRELANHMVAIKVLYPEVSKDKIASARFRNEIFAAYGVSHPNVVRAYEYIKDGDIVAYTMEYVGGGDLAHRLESSDKLTINQIMKLVSQISSGVQAIHDADIVHRDLKPENILLTKEGLVKIADFGIARVNHGPKLTEHGGVVGTIDYVSPEYMLNSQVDWRSDIYAIGILGYEMVTGESPFRGDSVYETMNKRLNSDPEKPSNLNPDCPSNFEEIILHAMARNPEERYQSAAEVFFALQPLIGSEDTTASGAFLQVAKHSGSTDYVGPSVKENTGTSETEDTLPPPEQRVQSYDPPSKGSSGSISRDSGYSVDPVNAPPQHNPINTPQHDPIHTPQPGYSEGSGSYDFDSVRQTPSHAPAATDGPFQSRPAYADPASGFNHSPRPSGTRPSGSLQNVVDMASQYQVEDTVYNPVQANPALSTGEVENQWGEGASLQQVITNTGSISESRVQSLSQLVDRVERSVWVEIITLVVAILIGVGVGFAVVKGFFPELIEGTVIESEE